MFQQNVTFGPGTGTFTQHTFEILIMLLGALLLGLWLGWVMWGKYKQMVDKLTLDNHSLNASVEALQAELAAVKSRLATSDADYVNISAELEQLTRTNKQLQDKIKEMDATLGSTQARNRVVETELGLSFSPDTEIAHRDIPLEIENSEATIPEEVVPPADTMHMMEEDAYHADLAGMAPVEAEPLVEAFTIVDSPAPEIPVAEPEIEVPAVKTTLTTPATGSILPVAEPPIGAAGGSRDDLTVVEGIGPKIQELLYQYGIMTYTQLAETEVVRLREILASAGPQLAMHDPGTWPSQANLAANDEWDNLKAIQKFLKGGKKPT